MGVQNCNCKDKNERFLDEIIYNGAYEDFANEQEIEDNKKIEEAFKKRMSLELKKKIKNFQIQNSSLEVIDEIKENVSTTNNKNEITESQNNDLNNKTNNNIKNDNNNINNITNNNNENRQTTSNNINNKKLKSKAILKNKNEKNDKINYDNKKIKNFNIFQIIPEKKLFSLKEDDIVFASDLERMINNSDKGIITYSNRFCILTKSFFSYFSSKESFIRLKKPLFQINIQFITRIEEANLDENSYYFCLVFKLNDQILNSVKNINSFTTVNEEEKNEKESMLGFKSSDEDLVIKWVSILNFFMNKS
jgi:hypothetical protein